MIPTNSTFWEGVVYLLLAVISSITLVRVFIRIINDDKENKQ